MLYKLPWLLTSMIGLNLYTVASHTFIQVPCLCFISVLQILHLLGYSLITASRYNGVFCRESFHSATLEFCMPHMIVSRLQMFTDFIATVEALCRSELRNRCRTTCKHFTVCFSIHLDITDTHVGVLSSTFI